MSYVKKGDRVKATWIEASPVSLSGVMPKMGGTPKEVEGTVTHIRGDRPIDPTEIRIAVNDGEQEHWVKPEWIVEHTPAD